MGDNTFTGTIEVKEDVGDLGQITRLHIDEIDDSLAPKDQPPQPAAPAKATQPAAQPAPAKTEAPAQPSAFPFDSNGRYIGPGGVKIERVVIPKDEVVVGVVEEPVVRRFDLGPHVIAANAVAGYLNPFQVPIDLTPHIVYGESHIPMGHVHAPFTPASRTVHVH